MVRQCIRLPCIVDKDCPGTTACNKDEGSGYCSAFKCRKNVDCVDSQVMKYKFQLVFFEEFKLLDAEKFFILFSYFLFMFKICVENKCVMPAKCNVDLDCKRTHLCQNSLCTSIKCLNTSDCPQRSKCDEKGNYCRSGYTILFRISLSLIV